MIKLTCTLLLVMLTSALFAQKRVSNWTPVVESSGVKVESKHVSCVQTNLGFDRELVLLKISNQNPFDVTVSYDLQVFRNNVCTTCDKMPEYHVDILVKANSTMEGDCLNLQLNQLKIFAHFLDDRYRLPQDELTDFKLEQFTVTPLN
jgi:hypothetical protein